MVTIGNVASAVAFYLRDELGVDEGDVDVIRFGLEIVLGALLKVVAITLVSYLLGIMPLVLAVLLTSSSFRLVSGGVHFHTFARCTAFSIFSAVFIGYIAMMFGPRLNATELVLVIGCVALVGYHITLRWAPADTEHKPITNESKKRKLKMLSRIYVFLWAAIATVVVMLLHQTPFLHSMVIASIGGFALQVISIIPFTYRCIAHIEGFSAR